MKNKVIQEIEKLHKENDRMNFEKNHEIMMESLNRSDYVAKKGIIKNY